MDPEAFRPFFFLVAAAQVLALAVVITWRAVNRRRVGRVKLRVRRRARTRAALVCAAALTAVLVPLGAAEARGAGALLVLGLSVALLALSPGFQDSVWGETGVQRGWSARRLEKLEAWRLIGEHLRWSVRGEWLATDVPAVEHAALRARLEVLAPGREAAHGNAGFDPQRAAAAKSNS